MRSPDYVQLKLQAWAGRKGLQLQGSAGQRGAPNYTMSVGQNIFGGEIHPSVRDAYSCGAGKELDGPIPTMSALHSSAALTVNLFQYWAVREELPEVAELLDVPSTDIMSGGFEDRFPVCSQAEARGFPVPPHLDFALRYQDGSRVGVECKLFEPYGRLNHAHLKAGYLDLGDVWEDIPACHALAQQLVRGNAGFHRLGASQLIKHILGLRFQAPCRRGTTGLPIP